VLIGMILGPMAEKQLRNALAIAQGDWTVFLTRPLSLVILCVIVAVLVLPRLAWLRREPTPLSR
jgi:putative tricarboxylic transport membrane protein